MTEAEVSKALYGPQVRSGTVSLTPLFPCQHGNAAGLCREPDCGSAIYRAAEDPRHRQPWVEEWIDWNATSWFGQVNPVVA